MGNHADAVLVGVDQITAKDLNAADRYGRTKFDEPDIGVADAGIQAEELETQRVYFIEVSRATAGNVPNTPKLLVDRRGHFAELGSQSRRVVEILSDRDLGSGVTSHVSEVVPQQVEDRLSGIGRRGARLRGHRVADDGAQVRQQASDRVRQESGMTGTNVEQLDGIRDRRCAHAPQRSQFRGTQPRFLFRHASRSSLSLWDLQCVV